MGVEMCKGKAKAARREPNGKYFGQNEPFFSLPFFAEMAGKDAYLVIFFRKYTMIGKHLQVLYFYLICFHSYILIRAFVILIARRFFSTS